MKGSLIVRSLSASVLLVAAFALSACGSDGADADDASGTTPATLEASEPETFTASGIFVLHGTGDESYGWTKNGSPCEGQENYSDIREGTQVVISNSSGEAIALGALAAGSTVEDDAWYQCHFAFAVADVPLDGNIYSVEVGGRGSVPFALDDADSLAIELGG